MLRVQFSHFSLSKEVSYYEKEVAENELKLNAMREQKMNSHDIKRFEDVLGESYMMVPDSKNRLEQALSELHSYMQSTEVEGLETNEWYIQAKMLLQKEFDHNDETDDIVQETDIGDLQEDEAF
jgi:tubulin-specific chaperone A